MKNLKTKEQFKSAAKMILDQEAEEFGDGIPDFENAVLTVVDLAMEHNQRVANLVPEDYTLAEYNKHLNSCNIEVDPEKLILELEEEYC